MSWLRRPDALVLGLIGLALVALALPRAIREVALLPHRVVVDGLSANTPLDPRAVNELGSTVLAVHDLAPSSRLDMLAALIARRGFESDSALASLRSAARLAPGSSDIWTRLALGLPPGQEAAHALRLSALTSAFEYDSTPRRVDLGLRLWSHMDDGDKQAFGRLVWALWRWETGRLAMVAARRGGYEQIAPYFSNAPRDWDHFTRSYAIHRLSPEEPYMHGP